MKPIILILLSIMTLINCSDSVIRSRKNENRRNLPPEKLFEDIQLQAAKDIFDENNTALLNTIKDHPEVINQLSKKENKGYTLLHYASLLENMKAMETLLQNGADPNIITPEGLPVKHAVALNSYDMLSLLLKYHATLNPAIGSSPLSDAMMLGGGENTERKMINYLLANGADINHTAYNGGNIMEDATRDDLDLATYFLEKGGQPVIPGTSLCPMADYIQYKEKQKNERNLPDSPYYEKLFAIKKQLVEKYNIKFPYKKDLIEEAKLRIKLYENLSPQDKISINFNKNYGENRYQEDLELVKMP